MIVELDVGDPDTADRIVQIQRAAYAVEAKLMGFWGIPQLHETIEEVSALRHLCWRGACHQNALVGLVAWDDAADVVDIDRLAVDPAHSRQGHGRLLVQSVPSGRETAVSTGRANTPALALYLAEGFRQVGETEVAPGIWTAQFQRKT